MTLDRDRVLDELPLPLGPDAGERDAIEIAIAVEDGFQVRLPDEAINVAHLGRRESVAAVLRSLPRSR